MTLPLWPQQDLGPVRRGDIFALGRHRLACIDATDKAAVARLFDGRRPTLVVTSPPYADARDYNDPIPCWDSMMLGALDGHAFAADVQLLVNLGVVHRKNEWFDYWSSWAKAMRLQKWRQYSVYIWAKTMSFPGAFHGRLRPSHEQIFHFNKETVKANAWVPNKWHGNDSKVGPVASGLKKKDGIALTERTPTTRRAAEPLSVISMTAVKSVREASGHPAQMPISLAAFLIRTWKKDGCVAYDPFGGSGTLAHAAENEGVNALMAEISPAYVQLAIDRWRKMHPDKPVRRLTAPAT